MTGRGRHARGNAARNVGPGHTLTEQEVDAIFDGLRAASDTPREAAEPGPGLDEVLRVARRRVEVHRARNRERVLAGSVVLFVAFVLLLEPVWPSAALPQVYVAAFLVLGGVTVGSWFAGAWARRRPEHGRPRSVADGVAALSRQCDLLATSAGDLGELGDRLREIGEAARDHAAACRGRGLSRSASTYTSVVAGLEEQSRHLVQFGAALDRGAGDLQRHLTAHGADRGHRVAPALDSGELPVAIRPLWVEGQIDELMTLMSRSHEKITELPFVIHHDEGGSALLAASGTVVDRFEALSREIETRSEAVRRISKRVLRSSDVLSSTVLRSLLTTLPGGPRRQMVARVAAACAVGVVPGGRPRLVAPQGAGPRRLSLRRAHHRRLRRMDSRAAFISAIPVRGDGGVGPIARAMLHALARGFGRHDGAHDVPA
jgi:hypothetical protein